MTNAQRSIPYFLISIAAVVGIVWGSHNVFWGWRATGPEVPAKVVTLEVVPAGTMKKGRLAREAAFDLRGAYSYTVNGSEYQGTNIGQTGSGGFSKETADSVLASLKSSAEPRVRYNPARPSEAFLKVSDGQESGSYFLLIFGVCVVVIALTSISGIRVLQGKMPAK